MSQAIILPSALHGSLTAPASKSMAQRALALALLHRGRTVIRNAGHSKDVEAAVSAIEQWGAKVTRSGSDIVEVRSEGRLDPLSTLHCGESGLCARIFIALSALADHPVTITGEGTLMNRPMEGFRDCFSALGVSFHSDRGNLPVTVNGPYKIRDFDLSGKEGSQYLTGLLMALAYAADDETVIRVHGLTSRSYIDMTIQMLAHFGFAVSRTGYEKFCVRKSTALTSDVVDVSIEGDWSSASFLLVASAISGNLVLTGLKEDSVQGDRRILDVLKIAGVFVKTGNGKTNIEKSENISSFQYDSGDTPDLFPPLAILASFARGTSVISGIHRLHAKESDRAQSIMEMLSALGIRSRVSDDKLIIEGGRPSGGLIDPSGDHRIVMASAVAALGAQSGVTIKNSGAVTKSYPSFFEDLRSLGASVTLTGEKQIR